MRLINADELRDIYSSVPNGVYTTGHIITAIDECKTVDAAPVVHGKWTTKRTQEHDGEWYCTVCDYEPIVMSDDMKYCPGCGAKMDLEKQDAAD